jgi:glycosyltransferase involved in cell wall biosynthesis
VISVVICTHNPLPHFLRRTLEALRQQTLPLDQWELLLIDNLSSPPLAGAFDLAWHPAGRIVVEPKLGLTQARWRGFRECRGDLLVYVDDDNLLAPDYLAENARLDAAYPFLGAWGGQILMEFDTPPTPQELPFARWQLHKEFTRIKWLNFLDDLGDVPPGAGLVVRRAVMEAYVAKLAHDPLRQTLGRTGSQGFCREDTDIVLTSFELGLGMGAFPSLSLRHLTPPSRLTLQYCLGQAYGLGYSTIVLDHVLKVPSTPPPRTLVEKARAAYHYWRSSPLDRSAHREHLRGRRDAQKMLREFNTPPTPL